MTSFLLQFVLISDYFYDSLQNEYVVQLALSF